MHAYRPPVGVGAERRRFDAVPLGPTAHEWNDARLRAGRCQPGTHRAAIWHIRKLTDYLGWDTPMGAVTVDDLNLWVECLGEDGLEVRSRNQVLGTARRVFAWAAATGLTAGNPMVGIYNLRAPRRAVRPVPPAHVSLICEHADLRTRTIIVLLAQIGFRRGELARILWDDYDPGTGVLLIRQGKGQKDHTVVLEREPAEALAAWRTHSTWARPPVRLVDTGPVFPGRRPDKPMSPGRLYTLVVDASHAVGLHYTPHQYRHTCATQWTRRGASTAQVARQLGHADLSSAKHYIDLDVEDLRAHVAPDRYYQGTWPGP